MRCNLHSFEHSHLTSLYANSVTLFTSYPDLTVANNCRLDLMVYHSSHPIGHYHSSRPDLLNRNCHLGQKENNSRLRHRYRNARQYQHLARNDDLNYPHCNTGLNRLSHKPHLIPWDYSIHPMKWCYSLNQNC